MNTTEKELEDFRQYNIGNYLWIYVSPILIIVGTFGNFLSICVLLRPKLRCSTTMFYLTCLSFGDLFTLYTGLLRYWISKAFDVDVRHFSNASCKIHTFLVYLSLDFTVWVLVSVTIDRCLSVSIPFRAKILCTLKRAGWVIAAIIVFLVIKNMHFFWNLQLVNTWEFRCDAKTEAANNFLRYVWPWIDFSTFCLIPFSIMIACNIKIIYEMVSSQKKLDKHNDFYRTPNLATKLDSPLTRESNSDMAVQSMTMQDTTQTREITSQMTSQQTLRQTSQVRNRSPARRISSLTAMLLTVNCVFLVTTSPIQTFLIGEEYWYSDKTPEEIAWHNFWWAVVNMLQYINNSIHFFLYCVTGPRFRNELKSMFLRKHKISVVKEPSGGTEV
ncbi:G-protein coupled receptor dmsr-1-like [Ruditapes philippinarum]|uniref:G-protein coupled receptor dmsr-1-like n=1 Tax=Ruditapes philippinarum TaxID=129788 RepID=UPI00295C0C92|nr:G-protein coupled receptor dmsr-1-like [Ruditapes philippinarum]